MSVLHSTATFLTSEPLVGKQLPFSCKHSFEHKGLSLGLFPCSQGHVNSLRYLRLSVTDIQPTRETGATHLEIFRIREKNISSGYRGGVKIDLDFTFIAQCKRSMLPRL